MTVNPIELAIIEASSRCLRIERLPINSKRHTFDRRLLLIEGRRCQVIPTKLGHPSEEYPDAQYLSLYLPRGEWPDYLIYVLSGIEGAFWIVPRVEMSKDTGKTPESMEPYRQAWDLLRQGLDESPKQFEVLEFRHSGEANELRAKANEYREETVGLQKLTYELQGRVHQLQASIEEKLTKIRLYVRARNIDGGSPQLFVSNLSEFDLWINKVELIVTEANHGKPARKPLTGATRLSRGHTDDGYQLWGSLLAINANREDNLDMRFHVTVSVIGIADDPKTIESPKYRLTAGQGNTKVLETLEY